MQREFHHSEGAEPGDRDFRLHHDSLGRLVLTDAAGEEFVDVEPARAFPISDPENRVSIRDNDGHELRWIERLTDLPTEVRGVLEAELHRREFIPVVTRIVRMTALTEPSQWDVETDRGPTRFLLRSDEDVHRLEGRRAMIVDTHGTRYLIRDTQALDTASQRVLERYL